MPNSSDFTQNTFAFDVAAAFEEEDFFVSPANEFAAALINQWPQWSGGVALIYGPKASGKTHLSTIWARKAQAKTLDATLLLATPISELINESKHFLLENIDTIEDETVLFHLFNAVRGEQGSLLMSANAHPLYLPFTLPDWRSRLQSIPMAGLELPDEMLLRTLLMKQFSDRQLRIGADIIEFLAARMERSFEAVAHMVDVLDKQALSQKRNITIPFIKDVAEQDHTLAL